MKKGFLDDLARSLASPMPRRDAVRTLGASLAMGLFPWLRSTGAAGSSAIAQGCPAKVTGCGGAFPSACCVTLPGKEAYHSAGCYNPAYNDCCIGPNDSQERPGQMSWTCGKGACGESGGKCKQVCPAGQTVCARTCCKSDEFCQGYQCWKKRKCNDVETKCGYACCPGGYVCASAAHNLCCVNGGQTCVVPNSKVAVCCQGGQRCCMTATTAVCCADTQVCKGGICLCDDKDGITPCGQECCKADEICSKWKCCPKGKSNCDKQCCDDGSCCPTAAGEICCHEGEFCGNIAGAPHNLNCCSAERMAVTGAGMPVCCPSGTVATDNACCPADKPNCCGDETAILCRADQICSKGECVSITPPQPPRRPPYKMPPKRTGKSGPKAGSKSGKK